jgi:hypothetical protein
MSHLLVPFMHQSLTDCYIFLCDLCGEMLY